ncbi:MAG: LysM peptidoglycan-binding domain-containing protein [Firmicutes bacterium]|nr:LysM peptidoglycan-binding domain-containing protein [Bacillota bacterium]
MSQTASCPGFNYTIRAGDTFFKLAQRFGTTVAAIEAANPGVNPNNLQIGQVICIPTRPAPGPPPPTPACPNGFLYTIQAGDTFFKLAQRFGTTVAAIEAANPGVNPNNLQIGQVVCIPTRPAPGPTPPPPGCPNGFFYTIQAGDTFFLLAQRFGTTVAAIEAANPGVNPNNLQIGQVICIPVAPAPGPPPVCPGFFYTIRPGDTLFELAQRFGTTVAAIIAANPGIDPTRLVPGQQICIPVPAPPLGKRCIVMMPTDLAPNGEGVLFLDYGTNVVLGTASNVPDPTTFNQEVYKLWLREATTDNWVVTTMFRSPQDTWVGRLVPAQTLSVFTAAVISAEQAANVQRPVGSRVLTATIPPVS